MFVIAEVRFCQLKGHSRKLIFGYHSKGLQSDTASQGEFMFWVTNYRAAICFYVKGEGLGMT
jgi:hypothetical protein